MNIGIILKTFLPYDNKILIFDKKIGKLCVKTKSYNLNLRLNNGMVISYIIDDKKNYSTIFDIDIVEVPLFSDLDILFLHHVLELCNFLVPEGIVCYEIFEMLFFLCSSNKIKTLKLKKIFLCKLFLALGLYPENIINFNYIRSIPVDNIDKIEIDLDNEKILSEWIIKCLDMQSCFKYFKTKSFLNRLKQI